MTKYLFPACLCGGRLGGRRGFGHGWCGGPRRVGSDWKPGHHTEQNPLPSRADLTRSRWGLSLLSAPRTDPSESNLGTRLLPRVSGGEAPTRPRMKDMRLGEELT